ncbi:hypothetical protein M0R45_035777 [Rubus argutus]|uniref:Uncharacterized protein n=1 Tax=Rubus argutus TaxID=59490 RepID=A0AAW1VV11_RUBAR
MEVNDGDGRTEQWAGHGLNRRQRWTVEEERHQLGSVGEQQPQGMLTVIRARDAESWRRGGKGSLRLRRRGSHGVGRGGLGSTAEATRDGGAHGDGNLGLLRGDSDGELAAARTGHGLGFAAAGLLMKIDLRWSRLCTGRRWQLCEACGDQLRWRGKEACGGAE